MKQTLSFPAIILGLLILDISIKVAHSNVEYYCPTVNFVRNCVPACKNGQQCPTGRMCCWNMCGRKSCVQPNMRLLGIRPQDSEYPIYCNLVKCDEGEICQYDNIFNIDRCMRAY